MCILSIFENFSFAKAGHRLLLSIYLSKSLERKF